jgi:hypothetical protein
MTAFARYVVAVLLWLGIAILLAPVFLLVVVVLAGPHSSVLPSRVQPAVVVIGWLGLLAAPFPIARALLKRIWPAVPRSERRT